MDVLFEPDAFKGKAQFRTQVQKAIEADCLAVKWISGAAMTEREGVITCAESGGNMSTIDIARLNDIAWKEVILNNFVRKMNDQAIDKPAQIAKHIVSMWKDFRSVVDYYESIEFTDIVEVSQLDVLAEVIAIFNYLIIRTEVNFDRSRSEDL